MFDFGRVNAAWFEFESEDLDGEIEMSISEFNEPAVFNAGSQYPKKTTKPVRYGNTWRLELNKELYEGVRFAWIHIHSLKNPANISSIRLVCQIKPTNYEGSFSCSDPTLTRIWYTGAYTVKLNLLKDYFGAILMERSDRRSWTGDAHTSQAASLVAFGNFDFVKANLRYTATKFNGIFSYSLYWVFSLIDYYNYTGDKELLDEMLENTCDKLNIAYDHYGTNPKLAFYGWDERIGAGFEYPNCVESQNAYKMLSIRAWHDFSATLEQIGYTELAAKYKQYAEEKIASLRTDNFWTAEFGIHAAADAVNAGFINDKERKELWNAYSDRMQRVSYSPFNQYFIIQSMAKIRAHNEALTTIDDCWGGQLRYGGTTFFEVFRPSWNDVSKPNDAPVNNQCGYTSLTHPWSAGVTKWLSEEILGIKPTDPGFKTFTIKPHLSSKVTWVKGATPTPHGPIEFSYDLISGKCSFTVPSNTTATLAIPKAGYTIDKVTIKNKKVKKESEDENFIYYTGFTPGKHQIAVSYSGKPSELVSEPFIYPSENGSEDLTTQGNWKSKYGSKGYIFFNYDSLENRSKLPVFIENLEYNKVKDIHWVTGTNDIRALQSDTENNVRNLGALHTGDPQPCMQTMTIDVCSRQNQSYKLSLYFVDWDKKDRRSAIEILDLNNKELLIPIYIMREYESGKYITFNLDRPVRVRIDQVRGDNAALSGMFFD
jgi:hypothetical protein